MSDTVGIVIPAYRPDVPTLRQYVRSLDAEIAPATIRIELDAPGDALADKLEDVPARVNTVANRRGKGAAISNGFNALDTDVLAFADADGSTPARELARILAVLRDDQADLAVGSRRHPDATVATSQSYARGYLGDGFAWLARRLLDVNLYDYQCGAKALHADRWAEIRTNVSEPGFAWDVELLAIAGAVDFEIREIPIEWHDHPDSTVPPLRTAMGLGSTLMSARRRAQTIEPIQSEPTPQSGGQSAAVISEQEAPPQNDD